jgi:hypothetical protein
MKRFPVVFVIGMAVLSSTACLASKTSHVLYLSPSGAVTWTVHDRDVHSDAAERAQRAQEEGDFLRAIQHRTHGPLLALEALGGRNVTSELVRAERPWDAVTTAQFDRIDGLFNALLRELGTEGRASLTSKGGLITLRVEWSEEDPGDEQSPALELIEVFEAGRVVLTEGRFVAAEGFVVSQDGREASLAERTPADSRVSLTWIVERERERRGTRR